MSFQRCIYAVVDDKTLVPASELTLSTPGPTAFGI
jgi:hypothetical protein